ncbi:alcohol dehydrogenase GroES domain protein [Levilactobacillus paucivorans]|uniref:Alcohol dehydrogenase GroES domain protein n=1 Tax=Levilactobacillus paucivorans TaxID=616990 RepID=A0A0R2LUE1_9LACO|nr:NADP-dependent oxidoreductase [Levilactobacillus paucivorans]KRO04823.1 alcohol dehydrogenase GroES domain protein [Levilactobacillus paucivorans]
MQAAQLRAYHKDFKLQVHDVPMPTVGANDVLVKVKVAAVNPVDGLIGTGSVKLIQDYAKPVTLGNEFSGVISAVGSAVTAFKVGQRVYARLPLAKIGAFAEYVAIDQNALAVMPDGLDFAHGAAVPLTGLTAYQALHDVLDAHAGESVMIPGGSGSFGQMAIPLAKAMGLTVAVSGNARGREAALELGADQYFDYRQENYWETLGKVDYVIDTIGPKELDHELAVLKPGGRLLSLVMGPNRQFAVDHQLSAFKRLLFTFAGLRLDRQTKKIGASYRFIFVQSSGEQLKAVSKVVADKQLSPAIDPTEFTLAEINQALDLVLHGHSKGKVLIRFAD